jgi:hypothetical protein
MDLFTFVASMSEHTRERVRLTCAERNFVSPRLAVRLTTPHELCVVATPLSDASLHDLVDLEDDLQAILATPLIVVSANSLDGELLSHSAVAL